MEQGNFSASHSPLVDFDGVCQKVRAALDPTRVHAVSLHDEHADVLWLSESSMGPDEHNAVRDALEEFAKPNGPAVLAHDLGDARSALLLRSVNNYRVMAGAVMAIVDTRGIKRDEHGAIKMMTPKLQRVLAEFAAMRPGGESLSSAPASQAPALSTASASKSVVAAQKQSAASKPVAMRNSTPTAAPVTMPSVDIKPSAAASTATPHSAGAATDVKLASSQKKTSVQPEVTPEIDRLHAALRRSPIALHVQRLMPLTKGSQMHRYEVLLRSKSEDAPNSAPQAMLKAAVENGLGSMIDRRVVTELIGWLVHHPDIWQFSSVMFSVNLTTTALHDEHFIKFIELCLAKSSLPKGTIAFEVDVPTAVKMRDRVGEVAVALQRLACPLILDDFKLRTECFELLRLPGVRYVKLASEITAKMRTDKISQAAITAVVQMSRVLGMHTVAKRTESLAEQDWLTALGVDFIQSNSMAPPVTIESLAHSPFLKK